MDVENWGVAEWEAYNRRFHKTAAEFCDDIELAAMQRLAPYLVPHEDGDEQPLDCSDTITSVWHDGVFHGYWLKQSATPEAGSHLDVLAELWKIRTHLDGDNNPDYLFKAAWRLGRMCQMIGEKELTSARNSAIARKRQPKLTDDQIAILRNEFRKVRRTPGSTQDVAAKRAIARLVAAGGPAVSKPTAIKYGIS